jgi:transcriptional regulator with XRE-family HTH domain
MEKVSLGKLIRELRKNQGFSQRELAQRVGIDFTYLSKIENDHAEAPSEEVLKRISAETGGSADELILLAGKMPSDIVEFLANNPARFAYLRRLLNKESQSHD